MKGTKQYRWESNPKEKQFHDKFIEELFYSDGRAREILSSIVFGSNERGIPESNLTEREEIICINLIQWLGSPVGQGFLMECGFKETKNE